MTLLRRHKFKYNPFIPNASQDTHLAEYFVDEGFLETLLNEQNNGVVVYAPRGGGKTACRIMFEHRLPPDELAIVYNQFPFLSENKTATVPLASHLVQLIRLLICKILGGLQHNPTLTKELTDLQKYIIAYLSYKVLNEVERREHGTAISALSGIDVHAKRFSEWFEAGGKTFIQKIATAALGALRRGSGQTINIENLNQVELELKKGGYDVWSPSEQAVVLSYFFALIEALPRIGIKRAVVLVDSVDELEQTARNPKSAFDLVSSLLTNLFLYEHRLLAFRYFLWDRMEPFWMADQAIRRDRLRFRRLRWTPDQLDKMLGQRLKAASPLTRFDRLAALNITFSLHRLIAHVASGSPRDMVRLANWIIDAHDERYHDGLISEVTIWDSVRQFCGDRATELLDKDDHLRITQIDTHTFQRRHLHHVWGTGVNVDALLQKLRDNGAIVVVDYARHATGEIEEHFGYGDLRIAIGTNIEEHPKDILASAYICGNCKAPILTKRRLAICERCQGAKYTTADLHTVWSRVHIPQK